MISIEPVPCLGSWWGEVYVYIHVYVKGGGICAGSFVNLTQSSITWEESLNEGLFQFNWPVGMSLRDYLDYAN